MLNEYTFLKHTFYFKNAGQKLEKQQYHYWQYNKCQTVGIINILHVSADIPKTYLW